MTAADELDRLIRETMEKKVITFNEAWLQIVEENPKLVLEYQKSLGLIQEYEFSDSKGWAGVYIEAAIKKILKNNPGLSYGQAFSRAVADDPGDARLYAEEIRRGQSR